MFDEMRKLAEKWHAGQFRDGREGVPKIPYFEHPKAVVRNLLDWGEPQSADTMMIAWGHDLLEDTDATQEEILAASNENVLNGIRLLSCLPGEDKRAYLRQIADSRNRDAILVKLSDRIHNTGDFIHLKGKLHAFRYLHKADAVFEAAQKLPQDAVMSKAIIAWKELDESLRDEARHDAICGCMLGGAVGDAFGAPVEFKNLETIKAQYGPQGVTDYVEFGKEGAITDDTQMALFTAEGILRAYTRFNEKGINGALVDCVRYAYLRWLKTQGGRVPEIELKEALTSGWLIREKQLYANRAPGMTCISALESSRSAEKAHNNSKGCGTVMRMAPVGLFLEPENAYKFGCQFSALTHGHPTGITAGGAFAMLIAELLTGKTLEDALDLVMDELKKDKDAAETLKALQKARTAKSVSELGQGWVAEEALAIGVYCALKHPWNFRVGVLEAVNITGDSDSTGSIAGNILGVIRGKSGIPSECLSNLREKGIVAQVADDLWKRIECNSSGYATKEWWDRYPGF